MALPLPLPSHVAPIHTRCRAKRRGALSLRSQAWPPGECRARPGTFCSHVQRQRTPSRYPVTVTCTHECRPCRAVLALCAAGFTCRDLLGLLANALQCGINRLDVQLSRAACPPTDNVRQTESWAAQTLPSEHLSPRGRDWAPLCHGCAIALALPGYLSKLGRLCLPVGSSCALCVLNL